MQALTPFFLKNKTPFMDYSSLVSVSTKRRIQVLFWLRWLVLPAVCVLLIFMMNQPLFRVVVFGFCMLSYVAVGAWELSKRRQFVRESNFPRFLVGKLREKYPQLSTKDADLVLRGLRQFFMAHLRSGRLFVAMPSQVADAAWHEFILHTRAYEAWCGIAFGKLLHHSPAEVLGKSSLRNDGLRRAWYWACKEESINPRQPSHLPLLFALDKKFSIAGGFHYMPDCRDIVGKSSSDAYCGSDFGDSGSGVSGDSGGFGGSESSGSAGGGDGGDSGCGGGCGGGD